MYVLVYSHRICVCMYSFVYSHTQAQAATDVSWKKSKNGEGKEGTAVWSVDGCVYVCGRLVVMNWWWMRKG